MKPLRNAEMTLCQQAQSNIHTAVNALASIYPRPRELEEAIQSLVGISTAVRHIEFAYHTILEQQPEQAELSLGDMA